MTSPAAMPEASATVSVESFVLALAVSLVEAAMRSAQKLTLVGVAAVILTAESGKREPARRRSSSMIMPARAACCACARFRSEEHTSELQSLRHLVCRPVLENTKTHV